MHRRITILIDISLIILILFLFISLYAKIGLIGLAIGILFFILLSIGLSYEAFLLPMKDRENPKLASPFIYDIITNIIPGHDLEAASMIIEELGIDDGMRVLEIGTGTGWFSIELAKRKSVGIESIDICKNMVFRARLKAERSKIDNINFEHGNAEDIQHPDHAFDSVLSIFNMNVIKDKDRALKEMIRVVKPSGKIAIYIPKPLLPHMFDSGYYIEKLRSNGLKEVGSMNNITCSLIYGTR